MWSVQRLSNADSQLRKKSFPEARGNLWFYILGNQGERHPTKVQSSAPRDRALIVLPMVSEDSIYGILFKGNCKKNQLPVNVCLTAACRISYPFLINHASTNVIHFNGLIIHMSTTRHPALFPRWWVLFSLSPVYFHNHLMMWHTLRDWSTEFGELCGQTSIRAYVFPGLVMKC